MKNVFCYDSLIGKLLLEEQDNRITRLSLGGKILPEDVELETPVLREAAGQLREYFAGERRVFDLPLAPEGTAFQRAVWDALCKIPYGETRSYGEIAAQIGNPKACRAVGMANHRNPIAVIIPCHRVIGSDGGLTGYAGGLEIKTRLLELERAR